MQRFVATVGALMALVHFGHAAAAAQEATPAAGDPPPLPGQIAEATREFRSSGARADGASAFRFSVGQFVDATSAEAAVPAVVERIVTQTTMTARESANVPGFGDETLVFGGPIASGAATLETVVVLVRDGHYLHVWLGAGLAADPLPDLVAVGERVFARPAPVDVTPATGDVVAQWMLVLVQGLNDLPPGFVMSKEATEVEEVATPAA